MKRQVDGPEELREPFGLGSFLGHATRVAPGEYIVNPDGFPDAIRAGALVGCSAGAGPTRRIILTSKTSTCG